MTKIYHLFRPMTTQQLADAAGTSWDSAKRMKRGDRLPTLPEVARICKAKPELGLRLISASLPQVPLHIWFTESGHARPVADHEAAARQHFGDFGPDMSSFARRNGGWLSATLTPSDARLSYDGHAISPCGADSAANWLRPLNSSIRREVRIDDETIISLHDDGESTAQALMEAVAAKKATRAWRMQRLPTDNLPTPMKSLLTAWRDGDVWAAANRLSERCAVLRLEADRIRLEKAGAGILRDLAVPTEAIVGRAIEERGDARYARNLGIRVVDTDRRGPTHWEYEGSYGETDLGCVKTFMLPLAGRCVLTYSERKAA